LRPLLLFKLYQRLCVLRYYESVEGVTTRAAVVSVVAVVAVAVVAVAVVVVADGVTVTVASRFLQAESVSAFEF
jgi:hypothetical protein